MGGFPFGVWGKVLPTPEAGAVEKIKIVPLGGGGYLVLTIEGGSEFDIWVATLEEVQADMDALRIEWPDETDLVQ